MTRTNEQWMAALAGPAPDDDAVAELRAFLQRGLTKALADRRLGMADLEDFAQEGTLRVLARLASFRDESRLTTWALSITIRIALTEFRRRRWKDVSLEDLQTLPPLAVEQEIDSTLQLEQGELLEALHTAIDTALTDRQRTVILAELAGTPGVVLAERLHVKPNALYKMYHDARKKLRRALNDAGFSDQEVRNQLAKASKI